jgi:hypothetical protein
MQKYALDAIITQLPAKITHCSCKITHIVQTLLFGVQRGVVVNRPIAYSSTLRDLRLLTHFGKAVPSDCVNVHV